MRGTTPVAVPDVILTEKCLAVFRAAKLSDHLRALRLGGIVAKEILPASKQASMAALGRRFVVSEILPMYAWLSFLQASGAAREEPESPSTDPQPKQARDLLIARASEIPTGAGPAPRALTRAASPSCVAIRPSPADAPILRGRQRRGRVRRNQHGFRRHTYRSGCRCSRRIAAGAAT